MTRVCTNNYGSGAGFSKPKNLRILRIWIWIRIQNNGLVCDTDPNFAHYDVLTLLQGYPSGTSTILRRDACHSTSVDVKVNIRIFDIVRGNTLNHARCIIIMYSIYSPACY
jgi:hypothetical protein